MPKLRQIIQVVRFLEPQSAVSKTKNARSVGQLSRTHFCAAKCVYRLSRQEETQNSGSSIRKSRPACPSLSFPAGAGNLSLVRALNSGGIRGCLRSWIPNSGWIPASASAVATG